MRIAFHKFLVKHIARHQQSVSIFLAADSPALSFYVPSRAFPHAMPTVDYLEAAAPRHSMRAQMGEHVARSTIVGSKLSHSERLKVQQWNRSELVFQRIALVITGFHVWSLLIYGTRLGSDDGTAVTGPFVVAHLLEIGVRIVVHGFRRFWYVHPGDVRTAFDVPVQQYRVAANRFDLLVIGGAAVGFVLAKALSVSVCVCVCALLFSWSNSDGLRCGNSGCVCVGVGGGGDVVHWELEDG